MLYIATCIIPKLYFSDGPTHHVTNIKRLSLNDSVSGSLYLHYNQYTINSSLSLGSIEVESKIPPSDTF
jgi:hypothetical protein